MLADIMIKLRPLNTAIAENPLVLPNPLRQIISRVVTEVEVEFLAG
jgi:hypothetical protein